MRALELELESSQRAAIAHPLGGAYVAITGAAGTGKSLALLLRAKRAFEVLRPTECAIVSAASELAVERMRATSFAADAARGVLCAPLGDIAFEILQHHRREQGGKPFTLIDDVRAEELVVLAGASLFALEWDELLSAEVDPEITGMRTPQRFASTTYRLIRKLRMAGLSPDAFAAAALRGATAFYGNPPNFANPDLIEKTQPKYRDSLRVTSPELTRQHTREVDLSKILARLYRAYLERQAERGWLTRIDALGEAAQLLESQPQLRSAWAQRYRFAFVDDAQDLSACDERFLRALFGPALEGVTLCGDPDQRTLAFAGPRAERLLEAAPHRFVLEQQWRSSTPLARAVRSLLPAGAPIAPVQPGAVEVHRAETMRAEAAYVAQSVARAIGEGVAPHDIAIIARSLRCTDVYIAALLDNNVPVDPAGEGSLYAFADVQDGLAALWAIADPYRHDWLLRNLEAPWLRLSDATIAKLCAEPAEPQALLFELPADAEDDRGRRWDRRRDFRLAWNVLRAERDADLEPVARERLSMFRAARSEWLTQERRLGVAALARSIFEQTVFAGATDARGRLRRGLVERLARAIERFIDGRPRATLHDFLLYAEQAAAVENDSCSVEPLDASAVAVLGVEAAKGREFAHVFVVDVRAGAFPRYYVPDAFQFTPKLGMIPKENVGEGAGAARTAKFTYFQYRLDLRSRYYAEERRGLYCAASRARQHLSISASGRPTKGIGAPEFLEELRALE